MERSRVLKSYPRRGPFDGAIVLGRNLAPHPAGSRSEQRGATGRELADSLTAAGARYLVDPDTPILASR